MSGKPELWRRAETLFHQLADSTEEERDQKLAGLREGDQLLYGEVRSLLDAFDAERAAALASLHRSDAAGRVPPPIDVDWLVDPSGEQDAWIGRVLGQYRLEHLLGRGGMGAVYKASRAADELNLTVAVKIIAARFKSEWLRQHFLQERQLLATLNHPHIARLIDGGFADGGEPYLVMEYVEGRSLDTYCEQENLDVGQIVRLFLQLCEAVAHTHRNLVVHRDLKPSNVLVNSQGVLKLLDFGAAKLLDASGDGAPATRMGLRAFTPDYASPEQIFGQTVTVSSDVYSLGVILYRILSGRLPFDLQHQSSAALLRNFQDTRPAPPSDAVTRVASGGGQAEESRRIRASQLRGDLDAIVLKALRTEPEMRYRDVDTFMADLRAYLEDRPVTARAGDFRYRALKFLHRNRVPVASAVALFAVMAAGATATVLQARVAVEEEARARAGLQSVRRLSRLLLLDFYDQVSALPGSQDVQRKLVGQAHSYLGRLSAESNNEEDLRLELIEAYVRLGKVQSSPPPQGLGDYEGALASLESGWALAEELPMEGSMDVASLRMVEQLLQTKSEVLHLLGRQEESAEVSRRAAVMLERAAQVGED